MQRVLLALTLVAVAALGLGAPAGARPADRPPARRVVIISVPTLTWQMVIDHHPPAIARLLRSSSVASLSVRTIGPRTSLAEGYATLGAGNRATVRPDSANAAYAPDDNIEGSTVAQAYTRRTGRPPTAAVLQLEIVDILRSSHKLHYGAEPGALGDALRDRRKTAAVIANADSPIAGTVEAHREAALAVMDSNGAVAGGSVEPRLTAVDPAWPFGVRADEALVEADVDGALADNDLVLVEAADMARLDRYRQFMTPKVQDRAERRAVGAADRLVGHVLDQVDLTKDIVILLSPVGPSASERLTTFAIAGPGFNPGSARSAATRRSGYVTLPDVSPTVLHALGVATPDSMAGTLISSDGHGSPSAHVLADMARTDEIARFRDKAVGPVSVAFIVFQVLVYGFAVIAVTGHRERLRPFVGAAALVVLAMPPLVFLSGLLSYDRLGVVGYTVALFPAAGILAAVAWVLGRGRLLAAPGLLIGTTLAVLLVDVVTGARLQINTAFGYSPIVAGRFAGYGNLAFAIVAMAAIVVGTIIWAGPRLQRPGHPRIGLPLVAT
ncbi:MAG: hypothetical protein ABIY48_08355, partial [Acidimicrobiales bacterium]